MQLLRASAGEPPDASGAPLLPKLRGEFAEFLNEGSHLRLRIFSSPTCVGLRYGYPKDSLEDFLGSVASPALRALRPSPWHLRECDPPDFPGGSPYTLNRHIQPPARIASCVPPSFKRVPSSSGILTGCPSLTPFGLSLGPTDPESTNVAQGNLRFSAERILTSLLATYAGRVTSLGSASLFSLASTH